jgi:hypothetical protein
MSRDDFNRKAADCFRAAAVPLDEGALGRLRERVDRLEQLTDLGRLARFQQA